MQTDSLRLQLAIHRDMRGLGVFGIQRVSGMFEGESIHSLFPCKGLHCIMKPECPTMNGKFIFCIMGFTAVLPFLMFKHTATVCIGMSTIA